jgi:hypothetical protein
MAAANVPLLQDQLSSFYSFRMENLGDHNLFCLKYLISSAELMGWTLTDAAQ